jgi:hypothetical protein
VGYLVTVLHSFDRSPDQIRISVAASDSGGSPDEVYTLALTIGEGDAQAIERLITDELKGIVSDSAEEDQPQRPNILNVKRSSTDWGGEFSNLAVDLLIQGGVGVASSIVASRIESAFRRIAAKGNPDDPPLTEEEAESKARYQLAFWYADDGIDANSLKRTEVERDLPSGRWSFNFEAGQQRYQIELGFIRGIPSTQRIKRVARSDQ